MTDVTTSASNDIELTPIPKSKTPWIILSVIVIILAVAGFWAGKKFNKKPVTYQAVFLNNGQTFFGEFTHGSKVSTLTDVYYIQVASSTPQLIKMGSEIHAPQDKMTINNDEIIYWETMKSDSQVVKGMTGVK